LDQKAGLLIAGTTDPQSSSQHKNGIGKDPFSPVLGRYPQSLIHWSVLLQAGYESKLFDLDNLAEHIHYIIIIILTPI
jgi:hypothetical protein